MTAVNSNKVTDITLDWESVFTKAQVSEQLLAVTQKCDSQIEAMRKLHEANVAQLTTKVEERDQALQGCKQEITAVRVEIQQVKDDRASGIAAVEAIYKQSQADFNAERIRFNEELARVRDLYSKAQITLDEQTKDSQSLRDALKGKCVEIEGANAKLDAALREIESMKSEHAKHVNEVEQKERAAGKDDSEKEIDALRKEVQKLTGENAGLKGRVENLTRQNLGLTARVEELGADNDRWQALGAHFTRVVTNVNNHLAADQQLGADGLNNLLPNNLINANGVIQTQRMDNFVQRVNTLNGLVQDVNIVNAQRARLRELENDLRSVRGAFKSLFRSPVALICGLATCNW